MTAPDLDWAVAERPKDGEAVAGDVCAVRTFADGLLVVVADGIGHGPEARAAATAAVSPVSEIGDPLPLPALVERCHEAARRTRGCVLSAAFVVDGAVEWVGVGNVDGVVRKAGTRERLVSAGGIVGSRLPRLIARTVPLAHGDLLLLATDGVPGAVLDDVIAADEARVVADQLLAKHAAGHDDALVFAARYRGARPGGGDGS